MYTFGIQGLDEIDNYRYMRNKITAFFFKRRCNLYFTFQISKQTTGNSNPLTNSGDLRGLLI